jgi:DNA-directed RNA polymerase subunit K/omega
MRRAARAAREIAVRTDTAVVVERDKKPVRITAEELRTRVK